MAQKSLHSGGTICIVAPFAPMNFSERCDNLMHTDMMPLFCIRASCKTCLNLTLRLMHLNGQFEKLKR